MPAHTEEPARAHEQNATIGILVSGGHQDCAKHDVAARLVHEEFAHIVQMLLGPLQALEHGVAWNYWSTFKDDAGRHAFSVRFDRADGSWCRHARTTADKSLCAPEMYA